MYKTQIISSVTIVSVNYFRICLRRFCFVFLLFLWIMQGYNFIIFHSFKNEFFQIFRFFLSTIEQNCSQLAIKITFPLFYIIISIEAAKSVVFLSFLQATQNVKYSFSVWLHVWVSFSVSYSCESFFLIYVLNQCWLIFSSVLFLFVMLSSRFWYSNLKNFLSVLFHCLTFSKEETRTDINAENSCSCGFHLKQIAIVFVLIDSE